MMGHPEKLTWNTWKSLIGINMSKTNPAHIIGSPIISLDLYRARRYAQAQTVNIEDLEKMTKQELLEEMVAFQEKIRTHSHLTPQMMLKGKVLFRRLSEEAETRELYNLALTQCQYWGHRLNSLIGDHTPDRLPLVGTPFVRE